MDLARTRRDGIRAEKSIDGLRLTGEGALRLQRPPEGFVNTPILHQIVLLFSVA